MTARDIAIKVCGLPFEYFDKRSSSQTSSEKAGKGERSNSGAVASGTRTDGKAKDLTEVDEDLDDYFTASKSLNFVPSLLKESYYTLRQFGSDPDSRYSDRSKPSEFILQENEVGSESTPNFVTKGMKPSERARLLKDQTAKNDLGFASDISKLAGPSQRPISPKFHDPPGSRQISSRETPKKSDRYWFPEPNITIDSPRTFNDHVTKPGRVNRIRKSQRQDINNLPNECTSQAEGASDKLTSAEQEKSAESRTRTARSVPKLQRGKYWFPEPTLTIDAPISWSRPNETRRTGRSRTPGPSHT